MKFHYASLETCHESAGVVILIDVLRAFSTTAYAFSRGAKDILPVSTVEEGLGRRAQYPGSKAMGEVGGRTPQGLDFGNSPTYFLQHDLSGLAQGRKVLFSKSSCTARKQDSRAEADP